MENTIENETRLTLTDAGADALAQGDRARVYAQLVDKLAAEIVGLRRELEVARLDSARQLMAAGE